MSAWPARLSWRPAAAGRWSTTATAGATRPPARPVPAPRAAKSYQASDIPVGGGKVFGADNTVVTQPTAGTFKAFSATCTHQGFTVGNVQGGTINCFHHGSKYNDATGAVVAGPAPAPLSSKNVTVSGGTITVT